MVPGTSVHSIRRVLTFANLQAPLSDELTGCAICAAHRCKVHIQASLGPGNAAAIQLNDRVLKHVQTDSWRRLLARVHCIHKQELGLVIGQRVPLQGCVRFAVELDVGDCNAKQ